MSKVFHAVSRATGEKWTPSRLNRREKQYLVMYDSGYLAVVTEAPYYTTIEPLDPSVWAYRGF